MVKITCTVHEIAKDGLPNKDFINPGMLAFLFEGSIISGWPINENKDTAWEASVNSVGSKFEGVTHWVEFHNSLMDFIVPI